MKRHSFAALLSIVVLATIGAQGQPKSAFPAEAPSRLPPMAAPRGAPITLDGALAFVGEEPALKVENDVYLLDMPKFYYFAYTEGFKAGQSIKVKGFVIEGPAGIPGASVKGLFLVEEAVTGGKTYVIVRAGPADAPPRFGPQNAKMGDQGKRATGEPLMGSESLRGTVPQPGQRR